MYYIYESQKSIPMSAITIRLPDKTLSEIDNRSKNMRITRSEYIRKSISNMNKLLKKEDLKNKFAKASKLVRKESMLINSEFSKIEYDPET